MISGCERDTQSPTHPSSARRQSGFSFFNNGFGSTRITAALCALPARLVTRSEFAGSAPAVRRYRRLMSPPSSVRANLVDLFANEVFPAIVTIARGRIAAITRG